jgi:hypothetical protein
MTRRALESTRTERRTATAGPAVPGRAGGGVGAGVGGGAAVAGARRGAHDGVPAADWPRVVAALRATDEDDLPLFGRLPG